MVNVAMSAWTLLCMVAVFSVGECAKNPVLVIVYPAREFADALKAIAFVVSFDVLQAPPNLTKDMLAPYPTVILLLEGSGEFNPPRNGPVLVDAFRSGKRLLILGGSVNQDYKDFLNNFLTNVSTIEWTVDKMFTSKNNSLGSGLPASYKWNGTTGYFAQVIYDPDVVVGVVNSRNISALLARSNGSNIFILFTGVVAYSRFDGRDIPVLSTMIKNMLNYRGGCEGSNLGTCLAKESDGCKWCLDSNQCQEGLGSGSCHNYYEEPGRQRSVGNGVANEDAASGTDDPIYGGMEPE